MIFGLNWPKSQEWAEASYFSFSCRKTQTFGENVIPNFSCEGGQTTKQTFQMKVDCISSLLLGNFHSECINSLIFISVRNGQVVTEKMKQLKLPLSFFMFFCIMVTPRPYLTFIVGTDHKSSQSGTIGIVQKLHLQIFDLTSLLHKIF